MGNILSESGSNDDKSQNNNKDDNLQKNNKDNKLQKNNKDDKLQKNNKDNKLQKNNKDKKMLNEKYSVSDTINWNNINTEDVSITNNVVNNKQTISDLVKDLKISYNTSESDFNDNFLAKAITNTLTDTEDVLSATSPFISSDAYNYLQKTTNVQDGGAVKKSKKKTPKHKKNAKSQMVDMSSSSDTSSTSELSSSSNSLSVSSSSSSSDKDDKHDKHKEDKHKHDKHNFTNKNVDDMSYLSSSAHTGGEFSDNASAVNQNFSVNTSDINMISEY